MRLKFTLELTGKGNRLPLNYQYEISSWIHSLLNKGDSKLGKYLKHTGFKIQGSDLDKTNKRYKPFTFSPLKIPNYHMEEDRMIVLSKQVELIVSLGIEKKEQPSFSGYIPSSFIRIGDNSSKIEFAVVNIEQLTEPVFRDSEVFITKSPICISWEHKEIPPTFLSPTDTDFDKLFFKNLLFKYKLVDNDFGINSEDLKFELLNKAEPQKITLKENKKEEVELIVYNFKFRISAPSDLIRFGYYVGFGEKTRFGLGFVEKG